MSRHSGTSSIPWSHHSSGSFNGQDSDFSRSRQPPSTVQARRGCAHPPAAPAGLHDHHRTNYPPNWTARQPVLTQTTWPQPKLAQTRWRSPSVHPTSSERVQGHISASRGFGTWRASLGTATPPAPSSERVQGHISASRGFGTWRASLGTATPPAPSLEGVQGQTDQPSSPTVKAGAWQDTVGAGMHAASETHFFDIHSACGEHEEFKLLADKIPGKKPTMCSNSAVEENVASQNCGAWKLMKKLEELEMMINEMKHEMRMMENTS